MPRKPSWILDFANSTRRVLVKVLAPLPRSPSQAPDGRAARAHQVEGRAAGSRHGGRERGNAWGKFLANPPARSWARFAPRCGRLGRTRAGRPPDRLGHLATRQANCQATGKASHYRNLGPFRTATPESTEGPKRVGIRCATAALRRRPAAACRRRAYPCTSNCGHCGTAGSEHPCGLAAGANCGTQLRNCGNCGI